MLSSSNASTWTPHQNSDLSFRLLAAKFTETYLEVPLGTVSADNVSDLIALANVERVPSETDVEFVLSENTSGTRHKLSEDSDFFAGENYRHSDGKSDFERHKYDESGALSGSPDRAWKSYGRGNYVTRSISVGSNTRVTITYEAYLTGLADVKAYVQGSGKTWTLVNLTRSDIGNSWVERTHVLSNFNGDNVRIKLVLKGNILYRPRVKALRVITI